MFRRKRAGSNASTLSNTTPAATTAAVQAFVKRQASDASLSSAAAAAALRTHATSPVPVGEIQTKRMMRRGSVSSVGSAATDVRPGLHRRGSSGSMTERSFRSPSPSGRQPVPKIPPIPAKSHRRSASQEAPALRVASPTPADGARGVSMDRGTKAAARKTTSHPQSLAQVLEQPDQPYTKVVYNPETRKLETRIINPRVGPAHSSQNAAVARPEKAGSAPWHLGAVTSGAEPRGGWNSADAPIANNRKKVMRPIENPNAPTSAELSGRMMDVPSAPAFRPNSPAMSDVSLSPGTAKKRTPFSKEARGLPGRPAAAIASQLAVSSAQTQKERADAASAAQRKAAAMLARPLSSYAPVAESASVGPSTPKAKDRAPATPSATASSSTHSGKAIQSSSPQQGVAPKPTGTTKVEPLSEDSTHLTTPKQATQPTRNASVSPARSAHFSDRPVVTAVKHSPPPRSISPVKSALKSHSPQRSSPPSSYLTAHDNTDVASSTASDDGATPTSKRTSARVRFEESPIAIGEAAMHVSTDSPTIASPQNSRFAAKTLLSNPIEDETMGARPLLPSFGSIRARKDRSPLGVEDTNIGDSLSDPLDSSSDHALGPILSSTKPDQSDFEGLTIAALQNVEAPIISVVPATPHPEEDKELQLSPKDETKAVESQTTQISEKADAAEATAPAEVSPVSAVKNEDVDTTKAETEDWDQVRAYWSSLSDQKKQEIEHEAIVDESAAAPLPPWPDRQYQDSVVRGAAPQAEQKTMRKSMRTPAANEASKIPLGTATTTAASKVVPASVLKPTTKPPLRRIGSDDSSASESSFKRSRVRSRQQNNADGGRYTMRGSMRGGPRAQPDVAPVGNTRMSLRQEAPARTLRAGRSSSIDEGTPVKESSGFFGLGKSKPKGAKSSAKSGSRFRSRFADSSDEDEPSSNWRSRFADSDSSDGEAPPMKLTPVRGIPKRAGRDEDDSTDLDDSDDEIGNGGAQSNARKTNGSAFAANHEMPSTMRAPGTPDGKKSKRGLFGLGKKKNRDTDSVADYSPSTGAMSAAVVAAEGVDNSPSSPSRPANSRSSKMSNIEPATRNRPNSILRRFSSPVSPHPPPVQNINAQNFAYPVPPIPDEYQQYATSTGANRPNTSDGVSEARRLGRLGGRTSMRDKRQSAIVTSGRPPAVSRPSDSIKPVIVSARTGKPKKFQGLRRVFGMTD